jgi:hypothetical protein
MSTKDENLDDRLGQATAHRLARLRTMPVDTSRLEERLRSEIPLPDAQPVRRSIFRLRPFRAIAASILLLIAVVVVVLLTASSGPALASSEQMAQMHEDILSGRSPVVQVESIDAANKALAAQSPDCPAVPNMPDDHVMACCMKSVKGKRVACVLLKDENVRVSMMVANAADMRAPTSPTQVRDGVTYHVQSFKKLNMVMAERNGRWICLIGEAPAERLMDLAVKLKF